MMRVNDETRWPETDWLVTWLRVWYRLYLSKNTYSGSSSANFVNIFFRNPMLSNGSCKLLFSVNTFNISLFTFASKTSLPVPYETNVLSLLFSWEKTFRLKGRWAHLERVDRDYVINSPVNREKRCMFGL